jgi:putative addiction module killer protein
VLLLNYNIYMSLLKLITYTTSTGKEPFSIWLQGLDRKDRSIIITRIGRVRLGNFGDCKSIKDGEGILELRIDYGPGYRIYFGRKGTTVIVLLIGGDKGSQTKDITKAKLYWRTFKES